MTTEESLLNALRKIGKYQDKHILFLNEIDSLLKIIVVRMQMINKEFDEMGTFRFIFKIKRVRELLKEFDSLYALSQYLTMLANIFKEEK